MVAKGLSLMLAIVSRRGRGEWRTANGERRPKSRR
jgi:hypothetical protein